MPPPTHMSGPSIPFDFFGQVLDSRVGYGTVTPEEVLNAITQSLSAAEHIKNQLLWRQALNPVWYLTITVAYILRIPFVILESAGLPKDVEKSIWAHICQGSLPLVPHLGYGPLWVQGRPFRPDELRQMNGNEN